MKEAGLNEEIGVWGRELQRGTAVLGFELQGLENTLY
jgi:hypothetical protein